MIVKQNLYNKTPTIKKQMIPNQNSDIKMHTILNQSLYIKKITVLDKNVHSNYVFMFIFQNRACDLRSSLALTLKRKILQNILLGCPAYAAQPAERERILQEYKCYLEGVSF